ncbi:MAG TPA: glycine--tRNA ligase subunit beta [Pseudomonadales bacterium]
MSAHDFLVELGCEELPPKALKTLRDAFADGIETGLEKAGLSHQAIHGFAAPRRLAVHVAQLQTRQADSVLTVDGPPVKAAFDAEGKPTKAAEGFAKKNGVSIDALDQSGEKLRFTRDIKGEAATALLPGIVQAALDNLPIAKRMRWGASRVEFVRPTQWLVMLFGEHVVECDILGQKAGRESVGHRFHHPGPVWLPSADAEDYQQSLKAAFVVPDFDARREQIRLTVMQLAEQEGGTAIIPQALLDEVAALVEWPVPLACSFEARFLAVPQEALIATMQDNQKYFCLHNHHGKLMNRFITVANIESSDPSQIIAGNEKVVRPRLTDAEFFYQTDRKITLAEHNERNRNIVFQAELGTVFEKTQRMEHVAAYIARETGGNETHARRAALLSKADLCTQMVGEFPELQGTMGLYYARHDQEAGDIPDALCEQYLPRFAGDALPQSKTGIAVALADKLDTLVGMFAIGQPPTGSKDPFALRRAALGILRILIENTLDLRLDALLDAVLQTHRPKDAAATREAVLDFLFGRYRAMYEEQGIPAEVILSVLAVRPMVPMDFDARIRAVNAFATLPDAAALAAANKRVANILSKETVSADFSEDHLTDAAEKALHTAIASVMAELAPAGQATAHYAETLRQLAALRAPIDHFFDQVMVMADDPVLRANRLALLQQFQQLFGSIADIALLATEKS